MKGDFDDVTLSFSHMDEVHPLDATELLRAWATRQDERAVELARAGIEYDRSDPVPHTILAEIVRETPSLFIPAERWETVAKCVNAAPKCPKHQIVAGIERVTRMQAVVKFVDARYDLLLAILYEFLGDTAHCVEHYERAVAQGNAEAQFLLADRIASERISDQSRIPKLISAAVASGHPAAAYFAGEGARTGTCGFSKDLAAAEKYHEMARARGCVAGTFMLGQLEIDKVVRTSDGCRRDPEGKAWKFYVEGSALRFPPAMHMMALAYDWGGCGYPLDKKVALRLQQRAADMGYPYSIREVGMYTYTGVGCEQNKTVGLAMIRDAAEKGVDVACDDLAWSHGDAREAHRWKLRSKVVTFPFTMV